MGSPKTIVESNAEVRLIEVICSDGTRRWIAGIVDFIIGRSSLRKRIVEQGTNLVSDRIGETDARRQEIPIDTIIVAREGAQLVLVKIVGLMAKLQICHQVQTIGQPVILCGKERSQILLAEVLVVAMTRIDLVGDPFRPDNLSPVIGIEVVE